MCITGTWNETVLLCTLLSLYGKNPLKENRRFSAFLNRVYRDRFKNTHTATTIIMDLRCFANYNRTLQILYKFTQLKYLI